MSVKLMAQAWDMDIPSGQKMVLLALCDHANDEGVCYPSQDKLAAKCSMSSRSVVSHIKWLEERGIVCKERRQSTQRRKSDLYQIDLDAYRSEPANSAPANSACANSAPAKFSPEPENFAPSEPENFAGSYKEEPSVYNHQKEPSECSNGVCTPLPPALPTEKKSKTGKADPRSNPDNVKTWEAYAKAYRQRYGVLPEANAKVRGQVAQFVKLVGAEKAPLLAAYYVSHNKQFFVSARHVFGLLLKDYQQIATDYAIGQQMTAQQARQAESTQSNFDAMQQALALLAAEEEQQS